MDFTVDGLKEEGFEGFQLVSALWKSCEGIPARPGVYVVLSTSSTETRFLKMSICGTHKGRQATVPVAELEDRWVSGSSVVYIGKAGGGATEATLHSRLRAYMRMGQGKSAGHFGGRYIWQLADSQDLLVAWKPCKDPKGVENRMLGEFKKEHGVYPYANISGPRD